LMTCQCVSDYRVYSIVQSTVLIPDLQTTSVLAAQTEMLG